MAIGQGLQPGFVLSIYHLYLIEATYSRKAIGLEVYEQESGERVTELMQRTRARRALRRSTLGAALGERSADEIGDTAEQVV